MRLVIEVLDGLIVEQRVDGALVGARVGLDRGAVVARAPLRDAEAPGRVRHQRGQDDQREAEVVLPQQHPRDQKDLDGGRQDGVERPVEQVGDRGAAALQIARHAAGAPVEMEPQAQIVQVAEHLDADLARRPRHHAREHHLAHLGEQRHPDARRAISEQQCDRQHHQGALDVEPVDDLLQRQRHEQRRNLGGHDQAQRQNDAAEIGAQVREESADHRVVAASRRGRPRGRRVAGFRVRGGGRAHREAIIACRVRNPGGADGSPLSPLPDRVARR